MSTVSTAVAPQSWTSATSAMPAPLKPELDGAEVDFVKRLMRELQSAGYGPSIAPGQIARTIRDSQLLPASITLDRIMTLETLIRNLPTAVAPPAPDLSSILHEIKELREAVARFNPNYGRFA